MKLATHQRELLNRCSSSPRVTPLLTTGVFFVLAWSCFFLILVQSTAAAFCWWYICGCASVHGIRIGYRAFDIITYKNMCLWVFGEYELATRKLAHAEIFKLNVNVATRSSQIVFAVRFLTHAGILLTCLVANWWILFCVYAAIVFVYAMLRLVCALLVRSYVKKVTPGYIFSNSKHSPYTYVKDFFPEDFTWTPKVKATVTIPQKNNTRAYKAKRVRLTP